MFARIKKSGKYEYLQIVENRREDKRSVQRVIATIGRMDRLGAKGHAAKCFSQWVWLSLAPSVNYEVNCPKERFVVPRTFSAPLWV